MVKLKKDNWFFKYYAFCVCNTELTENGCALFWKSLLCVILSPLIAPSKISEFFIGTIYRNIAHRILGTTIEIGFWLLFCIIGSFLFSDFGVEEGNPKNWFQTLLDHNVALHFFLFAPLLLILLMSLIAGAGLLVTFILYNLTRSISQGIASPIVDKLVYKEVVHTEEDGLSFITKERRKYFIFEMLYFIFEMLIAFKEKYCPKIFWK